VAEETASGSVVGYARSLERGGLVELTEFFVHPGLQAKGVGRALLARTLHRAAARFAQSLPQRTYAHLPATMPQRLFHASRC
jgi:GNAT superfamily N-acetyltransferase